MKKKIVVFVFAVLFTFTLSPNASIDAKENIQENNVISVDVTYNNWDDVKNAGDYYLLDNDVYKGLLRFKYAYRIGNTKKFRVTYDNGY